MNLFGNKDLALKIEKISALDDELYTLAMKKLKAQEDFGVLKFEGGESCYVGRSPFSGTHGFGINSEIHNQKLLTEIENFFDARNFPSTISITSIADQKIIKMLNENGYELIGFRNVYIYSSGAKNSLTNKIEIIEAKNDTQMKTWLKIVSDGFADEELDKPDDISLGQSIKEGNKFFIGLLDGVPAAASALFIQDDVARLGGMGTLKEFRGKGLQTAMINYRVNLATNLNCNYIFSDTQPGNNSQRNLERNGFKLAYVRATYRKNRQLAPSRNKIS